MTNQESEILARALEHYLDMRKEEERSDVAAIDALLARLPEIVRRARIGEAVEGFPVGGKIRLGVSWVSPDGKVNGPWEAFRQMGEFGFGATPLDALRSAGLAGEE